MRAQFLICERDCSASEALRLLFCDMHLPRAFNSSGAMQKPVRHGDAKGVEAGQLKPDSFKSLAVLLCPKIAVRQFSKVDQLLREISRDVGTDGPTARQMVPFDQAIQHEAYSGPCNSHLANQNEHRLGMLPGYFARSLPNLDGILHGAKTNERNKAKGAFYG